MGKLDLVRDYDATAHLYDERYKEEQMQKINFLLDKLSPKEGDILLDIGCGTGLLFEKADCRLIVGVDISPNMLREARKKIIAQKVLEAQPGIRVGARSDLRDNIEASVKGGAEAGVSEKLKIEKSAQGATSIDSKSNSSYQMKDNIELILADADFLPIKSGIVDVVVSVTALQLAGEQDRAISEIFRVLRNQGSFGLSIIKKAKLPKGLPKGTEIYDMNDLKDFICIGKKGDLLQR